MKRTEIERREREARRVRKREEKAYTRDMSKTDMSVGDFINALAEQLVHDDTKIYNTTTDEDVLEVLEAALEAYPEKIEAIIRKGVRKTKVKMREEAFEELLSLIS